MTVSYSTITPNNLQCIERVRAFSLKHGCGNNVANKRGQGTSKHESLTPRHKGAPAHAS